MMYLIPAPFLMSNRFLKFLVGSAAGIALASLQARDALACSSKDAIKSMGLAAPVTTIFNRDPPRILGPETKLVPPRYSGLSLFQVYLLLSKRFPEKNEYESTATYQARINSEKTFGIFYGYSSEHYLPFVKRVDSTLLPQTRFNADTNELTIEISGITGSSVLNTGPRIFIDYKTLNNRSYIGSNIYGNQAIVDSGSSCSTSVSLNSIRQPITEENMDLVIKIPANPQVAQQVRNDLSIIFLIKLSPPFHGYRSSYTKPTLTEPREWGNDEYTVHGDLEGVMVFQTSTGRILFNGT
jgi:hypothetical protein